MKRRIVQICILLLLIIICLLSIIFYKITLNKENVDYSETVDDYHQKVKQDMLNHLQDVIDKNENGLSFRKNEYEENGIVYWGEIYVINKVDDVKFVKGLLEYCEPIYGTREYEPLPYVIRILVGGIDLGYAGGRDYYPKHDGDISVGFSLPKEYNDALWDFLHSL